MKLFFLIPFLLICAQAQAQAPENFEEFGISYTHFIPEFEENQDLSKTPTIEIYTGVMDEYNTNEQINFIKSLIKKEQKFQGKDQVLFTADIESNDQKDIELFKEKFENYEEGLRFNKFQTEDSEFDIFSLNQKRNPSSNFFSSKNFWVLVKLAAVTGGSVLTMKLGPKVANPIFKILNSVFIAMGSSGVMYYSDKYEQYLKNGRWKNFMQKKAYIGDLFAYIAGKTQKRSPVISSLFTKLAESKTLKPFSENTKFVQFFAKNEKLLKWGWTEYLFVQIFVEGPRIIKDIMAQSAVTLDFITSTLSKSALITAEAAVNGGAIQMFADVAIYDHRSLEIQKIYNDVLSGKKQIPDQEKFLAQAKKYLESINTKKEVGEVTGKVKKFVYNAKEAHPIIRRIYRRYYIRNISLSMASTVGVILSIMSKDIPKLKYVAYSYTALMSAGGYAYNRKIFKLTKKLEQEMFKPGNELVNNEVTQKRFNFFKSFRQKYYDAIQNICNENLTKFK